MGGIYFSFIFFLFVIVPSPFKFLLIPSAEAKKMQETWVRPSNEMSVQSQK